MTNAKDRKINAEKIGVDKQMSTPTLIVLYINFSS